MAIKSLVIGYGSIGARHALLLAESGHSVAVVSRRPGCYPNQFADVRNALSVFRPEYIVVANETHRHHETLVLLATANFRGSVLVEKPLWQPGCHSIPEGDMRVRVGYVLRFLPALLELRRRIASERCLTVDVRCSSYLPAWRPDRDYRGTSSASSVMGGGVLRDLSHELDYLLWLFGPWTHLAGLGGRFSDLEITSEDTVAVIGAAEKCPAFSLTLTYHSRVERRTIDVSTDQNAYRVDLNAGKIFCLDKEIVVPELDMNALYTMQHQDALRVDPEICCTYAEGEDVVRMIGAIERAIEERIWIKSE